MKEIKTINIEEDRIYLKKGMFGYRIVHPVRDDNNKIIWRNFLFGGYSNLVWLIFFLLLILLYYLGTKELISSYKLVADNPCQFCSSCGELIKNISRPVTNWHLKA